MKVLFNPVRSDDSLTYEFGNDIIIVNYNGDKEVFDFFNINEEVKNISTSLPINPILNVKRINGELKLTLLKYHGADASNEELFPEEIEISENIQIDASLNKAIIESYDELYFLEKTRNEKMEELNKQCNYIILNKRFSAIVDGVEYFFSCDEDAQKNFDKLDSAFDKGRTADSPWTAYDSEGNVVRIVLTPNNFEPVYMAHLAHIQNNIIKLRDVLEPIVRSSTIEELKDITW